MRVLLLAAGLGTRLRPLTDNIPKCLAPVHGRPLLEYWLRSLFDASIEEVLINVHFHAEQVHQFVQDTPWCDKITLVYEPELLGTGGTLLANHEFFQGEPLMLAHADNLTIFDMQDFIYCHQSRPSDTIMTMMTFQTNTPESCGIVKLDHRSIVVGFHEKEANPPGNLANAAVYIFEPLIFDELRKVGSQNIDLSTEIIPNLVGKIYTYENKVYHRDIGTMQSWQEANIDFPLKLSPLPLKGTQ